MSNYKPATRQLIEIIIRECQSKHQLHPMEDNLNPQYNVELTFSVQEIREFLNEIGGIFGREWTDEWINKTGPSPTETEDKR